MSLVSSREHQDRREFYKKLAEAYQYPPWLIGETLTIPQLWSLWQERSDYGTIKDASSMDLNAALQRLRDKRDAEQKNGRGHAGNTVR